MVVHPALGHYTNTLVNGLMYHTNLSNKGSRPGIVHRIDKDTSGLLLVAKNDNIHTLLSEELSKRKINRKYIALVYGVINHDTGTIDAPIGRDLLDRKKMAVTDINSKDAITHFRVLERYKVATLIECTLETGRTHQIRVHMNYIEHPIVNDPVYGRRKLINDFGQMLHAKTIGFVHPITKEYMEFSCDAPKEFYEILNNFKQGV
jgi:23S rRNA pseudouridine1911/1915/1917 synthase